jgi:hypothetical protein
MSSLIVAHAGHWAAGLVYLAPVMIVFVALAIQRPKDGGGDVADDRDDRLDI